MLIPSRDMCDHSERQEEHIRSFPPNRCRKGSWTASLRSELEETSPQRTVDASFQLR